MNTERRNYGFGSVVPAVLDELSPGSAPVLLGDSLRIGRELTCPALDLSDSSVAGVRCPLLPLTERRCQRKPCRAVRVKGTPWGCVASP
jgi:hypothetical protein